MRVAVVGAGPAGIRAVERLVEAGLRPVWIEESPDGGGRIYQRPPRGFARDHKALYGLEAGKARAVHEALEALKPRTDWRPDTLVWHIRPKAGLLSVIEAGSRQDEIGYDAAILCTGAMDRVIPIPGWTLPGVTSMGGAQIALKAQGTAIGRRVVFCGTGPLLFLVAYQYAKAGVEVAAVVDTTSAAAKVHAGLSMLLHGPATTLKGLTYLGWLRRRGVPVFEGAIPLRIEGDGAVAALRFRSRRGEEQVAACDAVALGWGLKPEAQLADLAGVPFDFDPLQQNWVPRRDAAGRSPVEGIYLAGDGAGIGGADVAELAGRRAALALLQDRGLAVEPIETTGLDRSLRGQARFRAALDRAFPFPAALAAAQPDETVICRCEAITAGELRATADPSTALGLAPEVNRAKAFSRLGMGRCQGRVCGPAGAAVLAAALGVDPAAVGRLRGQPPVKPIPIQP
jgi:NADPH-dependent 2,4-dienoyl-CoA reductase/sulfur reductase-like enzyme